MDGDGKIHIPGKKLEYLRIGQQPVIKVSVGAYNKAVELANESSLPLGRVVSELILQGAELVVFDRGEG